MTAMHDLVFLFDVDNTLLDNDRVEADLAAHLTEAYGVEASNLYRDIFEKLRQELMRTKIPQSFAPTPEALRPKPP